MSLLKKVSVIIFFLFLGIQYANSQEDNVVNANTIKIPTKEDTTKEKEEKETKQKRVTAKDLERIVERKRSIRYYKSNRSSNKCKKVVVKGKSCSSKKIKL